MGARHDDELSLESVRRGVAAGRTAADVMAEVAGRIAACRRKGVWIYVLSAGEIGRQLREVEAARQAGEVLPLYGVPFAVKDNIDVAGIPTTAACREFSYVPAVSATSVRRLCSAGAIVVGKTNLDQFATGLVGTRSPYGVCENAFEAEFISGGSSSGSAVAVAAGLVAFSLGTDTAGSGRVPAAFNNLVGLKPTRGLISAAGVVPACRSLDCVSIFARDCAEAGQLLEIAGGFDAADVLSRAGPSPPYRGGAAAPEHGRARVGIPDVLEFFGNREAAALFESAVARVERLGCTVVPIDFSPFLRTGELLYDGPWVAERLRAAGGLLQTNVDALRPELRAILQDARRYTAADAFNGLHQLAGLRREVDEQWSRMDMLLAPTAGTIYRIAEVEADPLRLNRNLGHYTTFVNLLDLSAVAVPAGFLGTGLPWGVTFMARAFEEEQLLAMGGAFHARVLLERRS